MQRFFSLVLSALSLAGCSLPTQPASTNAQTRTDRARMAFQAATKGASEISQKLAAN